MCWSPSHGISIVLSALVTQTLQFSIIQPSLLPSAVMSLLSPLSNPPSFLHHHPPLSLVLSSPVPSHAAGVIPAAAEPGQQRRVVARAPSRAAAAVPVSRRPAAVPKRMACGGGRRPALRVVHGLAAGRLPRLRTTRYSPARSGWLCSAGAARCSSEFERGRRRTDCMPRRSRTPLGGGDPASGRQSPLVCPLAAVSGEHVVRLFSCPLSARRLVR